MTRLTNTKYYQKYKRNLPEHNNAILSFIKFQHRQSSSNQESTIHCSISATAASVCGRTYPSPPLGRRRTRSKHWIRQQRLQGQIPKFPLLVTVGAKLIAKAHAEEGIMRNPCYGELQCFPDRDALYRSYY